MSMAIGAVLPHYGAGTTPDTVTRFAQEAEEVGLATLWVIERLLRPIQPIDYQFDMGVRQMPEIYSSVLTPLETLTHVAAHTERIRLGTSVIDCLFHPPATLARRLATVDHYSRGRLTVGLGQGYAPDEFTAANVPMTRRGRGFDEYVQAMRAVWGSDPVEFKGDFYTVPLSDISPKPLQQPGPPLLMGAATVAAAARAGRLGIGLNPMMVTWEHLAEQLGALRKAAADAGHDVEALPVVLRATLQPTPGRFTLWNTDTADDAESELAPFNGTKAQIAEDIARITELGVDELMFDLGLHGGPPARQVEYLAGLAELAG